MTCRSLGDRRPRSSWEPSAAVIAILTVPHVGGEVRSDSVSLGVDETRAAQTLRHVVRPLDSSRIMRICLRLMIPGFWNWNRLHLRVPGSNPSVSLRFRDLYGPVIALPCAQGVAQQFLNFLPLPQGQ